MSRKKAEGVINKEITKSETKKETKEKPKKVDIILSTMEGEEMDPSLYFYVPEGEEALIPPYFNKSFGRPVNRDDLKEVFYKIFKKEDNFLFYKTDDKEVYIVIPPLKFSTVGAEYNSINGEFQKHAISFVNEGSVNVDTLKTMLNRVAKAIGYSNK